MDTTLLNSISIVLLGITGFMLLIFTVRVEKTLRQLRADIDKTLAEIDLELDLLAQRLELLRRDFDSIEVRLP